MGARRSIVQLCGANGNGRTGAPAFTAVINADDERFITPGDMPARIRAYCRETGQTVPEDPGAIVRLALEALALKYRYVLDALEDLFERRLERIHIVGGGIQNQLLCQFTADATQRPVVAGPVEATAIGNLMVQALGLGEVGSLDEARQVVRNSFKPAYYAPAPARIGTLHTNASARSSPDSTPRLNSGTSHTHRSFYGYTQPLNP